MAHLLPVDCLIEIFENLEEDKITLHSCLLVNRLWCEVSVRILWRDIWSFKQPTSHEQQQRVESAIFSTLIACLPNESKELIHKNGIFIAAPTSRPSLFNYAAFCDVLPIDKIGQMVINAFENDSPITPLSSKCRNRLIVEELIKLFMNQSSSLKILSINHDS